MKITNDQQLTTNNLLPRPPIVVIMGHVDHGKTTLLDYIRKTGIAAKEAGGITQSIGAYEIVHISHEPQINAEKTQINAEKILRSSALSPRDSAPTKGRKITFIDTPGHEAFSKMRARGAKIADLAILVVAADDSIQPQTKESIETLNSAKTPFIVAINKIDKQNADVEKIKNDLTANGVFLEGYGGNISWHAISAKTGEGVNELLDLILLAAELENLTYEPDSQASGVIIEAKSNASRGIIATIIITNGVLKTGDKIATPTAGGKIKCLENYLGKKAERLSPSSPALILGFENLPQIGEEFIAGKEIEQIKIETVKKIAALKNQTATEQKIPVINLILKADVSGSLEPLSETIKNYKYNSVRINILAESIGEITDGDVKDASGSNAIVIGFRVKPNKIAENLAKAQDVKIITSEIIYEILEILQKEIKLKEKPLPQAELEVLKIFSQKGKKQLLGAKVLSGTIRNNSRLKIIRAENEIMDEIGSGKITSLKKHKAEVNSAAAGEECGIMFESDITINEKDRLIWQ